MEKLTNSNYSNKERLSAKFINTPSKNFTVKPKSGLSLANLENIPKEIKSKLKLDNLRTSHSNIRPINISQNELNRSNDISYSQKFIRTNKSFSKTPQRLTSSSFMNKSSQNKVQSPTSNILKSHRENRYNTESDFNYLANEKFMKDAVSCGKEKLSTVALKSSSPDRYFYDNNPSPLTKIRMRKIINEEEEKINLVYQEEGSTTGIKKPSHGVLSDILDNQFSISSPSRLKIYQSEIDGLKNQEFKYKLQSSQEMKNNNKIYVDDEENKNLTVNLSYIGVNPNERFLSGLESVLIYLDPIFDRLNLNERIEKFIENLDDSKRSIRLGSIVALYIIIRKYQLDDNLKLLVLEKVISLLQNYESQEELFLVASLEVCSIFAPHEILIDNTNLISMFLTDFNFPRLQKSAFNCLISMEYAGLKTLVDLASKDFQDYQRFILNSLINTPHIQKIVIIRALLNEVYSHNPEKRHSALAALNRMYDLVGDTDSIEKLSKFFYESKIEKLFLASTIRTAGGEDESVLLKELKTNKDFSVRVAIASVLSYRIPKFPNYLKIKLDNDDAYSITKNLPGSFCCYYGKVSPVIYENNDNNQENIQEDVLIVNTRDFLATLQRMLIMNYDHSNPQIVHKGHHNLLENLDFSSKNESEILMKNQNYFELHNNDNINSDLNEIEEKGKILISEEVIKALCYCLKDYSTAVRDTAASSLGQIGLPESLLAVDYLVDSIKDEDVNVKSKVIWAIGLISAGCDNSVIYHVVEALKCNMWKVKSACLYTLSQFGYRCAKLAIPILIKLLKESAINKQTIAETMVKLGNDGETTLLRIMNQENDSNYKLKSSISKAFALSNLNSPNIDFIVECLFKMCKVNNSIIRKTALFAIKILTEKSDDRVTYLKRKNIIPFYYEMMLDKDISIQLFAVDCLKSLGPQGELIFIEGLTKDDNPIVRQNSAIGLSEMGPHTLRTLLIGLHDDNYSVRRIVEKVIVEKFSIESILDIFNHQRSSQRMSLKISIRDILEKDLPINTSTKNYLQNILISLERDINDSNYIPDENRLSGSNFNQSGKFSTMNKSKRENY